MEENLSFCPNCGTNLKSEMNRNISYQSSLENDPPVQQFIGDPSQRHQPEVSSNYRQQTPPQSSYYQQQSLSGSSYYQQTSNNTEKVNRPIGITLISIYEIILGVIIALISLLFFIFAFSSNTKLNGALVGTNYHIIFFVLGTIVILWGLIGIVGAILFLQWKNSGYILSLLFLITTGIILFELYFIPIVVMVASLIYFSTNKNFKKIFNDMKNNRGKLKQNS